MKTKAIIFSDIKKMISENKGNIFIKYNDAYTIKKIIEHAYLEGYKNVCEEKFDTTLNTEEFNKHFQEIFYKCIHGNSIPVLLFCKNKMTGTLDLQYGSETIYKSYLQLKDAILFFVI